MQAIKKQSLISAFNTQLRVIGALLMREILTKYGRENIGFMWLFVEPMIFVLGITALWSTIRSGHTHGISVVSFALTGYSSVLLWRNATSSCQAAVSSNTTLLYHRQVRVIDLYFSRLLLNITGTTISFIFLGLFFVVIEWTILPKDILLLLEGWFLLAWFAVSLGLTVGALTEMSELVARVWGTITYMMFPLSGAVFMLDWLPDYIRELLLWVPMVNATEMIRGGYYGDLIPTYYSASYLMTWDLVLMFCGLLLIRQVQEKIVP